MKTKELIKMLQEEDPSGEMDVVVDNLDILGIYGEPSYWDGCKQLFVRNEKGQIIGAEYRSDGDKLTITCRTIKDMMLDNPDMPVKVVDTFVNKRMQERVDSWRKEIKEILEDVKKSTEGNEK